MIVEKSVLNVIFKKVYNRIFLPFLRENQIHQLPEFISALIHVRRDKYEFREILDIVRKEPRSIIPYKFVENYRCMPVNIFDDAKEGLSYALVNEHRVFFPKAFNHEEILKRVRQSLWEQADESPHRYFHGRDMPFSGRYAVLIGASDCIFAMSILAYFKKVFLFEPDKKWYSAMKATLSSFKNKVVIIQKKVGDKDEKDCLTLDAYFRENFDKVDYIQADIEGYEMKMLCGAEELIKTSPRLKLSVCCYHNAHDEAEIGDFLRARGFAVRPSKGYMLLFMQYPLKYPYVRRGVLYASKCGLVV